MFARRVCLSSPSCLRHASRSISTNPPELPPYDFDARQAKSKLGKFEIERIHKVNLNPCLATWYKQPLLITQGSMQYIWDNHNKRYLDMFGGIATTSVGHCHPRVVEAATRQISKLWHTSSIYLNEEVHEYAMKLANHFPEPLNNVFFCNSGSEANDIAILMARVHTGAWDIVALRNAYHGASLGTQPLCGVGSWKFQTPTAFGVHHTTCPDPFKGRVGGRWCRDSPVQTTRDCDCRGPEQCKATDYYIEDLETVLATSVPKRMAAFFAESIQGVGGSIQFPIGYLKRAHKLVKERGGLFISDEVQTGFGRTGSHFWGFQGHGIVPDIVTMAKGIGNGFPLAAVVTTNEIAKSLATAAYFNTFGGNPLACVVGSAVLDVIDEDKLQDNCQRVGTLLLNKLAQLRSKYPDIVGDVRGKGLMIGVELETDGKSMSKERFDAIFDDCREMGLVLGKGGPAGNVFRIKPPMCINPDDVEFTIQVMKHAFERHYQRLASH